MYPSTLMDSPSTQRTMRDRGQGALPCAMVTVYPRLDTLMVAQRRYVHSVVLPARKRWTSNA